MIAGTPDAEHIWQFPRCWGPGQYRKSIQTRCSEKQKQYGLLEILKQ